MKRAIIFLIVTVIFSLGLFLLLMKLFDRVNILSQSIYFLIGISGLIVLNTKIITRLKYLERKDSHKPLFKIVETSCFSLNCNTGFDDLKQKISDKWVITFSDENEKVIKFRDKIIFKSYGSGAWLKLDEESDKVYLDYFSIGMTDIFKLRKTKEEIEQLNL